MQYGIYKARLTEWRSSPLLPEGSAGPDKLRALEVQLQCAVQVLRSGSLFGIESTIVGFGRRVHKASQRHAASLDAAVSRSENGLDGR